MLATIAFRCLLAVVLLLVMTGSSDSGDGQHIDEFEVRNLALRFGKDIAEGSAESTCLRKITSNFEEMRARVVWFDANKMAEEMRMDVENMLNWKKHAVERIANESQKQAANHTYERKPQDFLYYNMKHIYDPRYDSPPPPRLSEDGSVKKSFHDQNMTLSSHPNFENSDVNLDKSAVHIPINVWEEASDIVNDIKWSEQLYHVFRNNLAFDPSLSWQFFGSSKGFLRLYPATKWMMPSRDTERDPEKDILGGKKWPDLYDCRMRPWYIEGAASPKDVVLLLDGSGSMTGQRNSIAKNVVYTILDTLTDDDYATVLKFNEEVDFINPCFDNLVQANKRNVREFKACVDKIKPEGVANFSSALVRAFEILQAANRAKVGAQCNQAIMLITDGSPETYEDVFKQYNWPRIPIRVFTYLIGREVTANNEVYWMACHNRGYYTHVANLAEVREQVQQYVPVMSRPIVLSGERVFSWTPVYAHVSEIQLTDWVWEERDKVMKNKLIQQNEGRKSAMMVADDQSGQYSADVSAYVAEAYERPQKLRTKRPLQLMTTLSTPVFDTRNYTNITRRILVKNVYQDSQPETIRIANLLGVAGVDVPIKEIVKLTPAFRLGVNGYSFVTNNNGHLLYHPDLRPMFENMLKPFYSSVDMSEVELADNDMGPRETDPVINEVRDDMINRNMGWKKRKVKIHMDKMKRVVTRANHYIYGRINFTPFSLAIVLPEPYGSYRVEGQIEVKVRREENFTYYFRKDQYKVHPDWSVFTNRSTTLTSKPMNNYCLTTESREELLRKENLQQRHYQLQHELQQMAQELPSIYQQRMPYELLSSLANCLLDTSIGQIVSGLKDIQQITEKTLFEKRQKSVGKFREMRVEQQKRNRTALLEKTMTPEDVEREERALDRYIEEETNKIDMKTITQLDQIVSDQQMTLEGAGVPGFHVTNNPIEIRVQMYILEFIARLSSDS